MLFSIYYMLLRSIATFEKIYNVSSAWFLEHKDRLSASYWDKCKVHLSYNRAIALYVYVGGLLLAGFWRWALSMPHHHQFLMFTGEYEWTKDIIVGPVSGNPPHPLVLGCTRECWWCLHTESACRKRGSSWKCGWEGSWTREVDVSQTNFSLEI